MTYTEAKALATELKMPVCRETSPEVQRWIKRMLWVLVQKKSVDSARPPIWAKADLNDAVSIANMLA